MNFLHTGEARDIACDETEAVISPSGDETRSRVSPEPKENELLRSGDVILDCGLMMRKQKKNALGAGK